MAAAQTYFEILGLPARYALDPAELEARYRELSQRWHPDRHGGAAGAERRAVLLRATDLNEAYRTIKSDERRAEYLLKLRGIEIGAETRDRQVPADREGRSPAVVDPELLMEVMELREGLQEARAARDHGRIQALAAGVKERMAQVKQQVAADFSLLEGGDQAALQRLAQALSGLRFYRRFWDEIESYEEAEAEAHGLLA